MSSDKFVCHVCLKQIDTRGKLNKHLKTHTKPLICETCKRGFALRLDLIRHIKARHRTGNELYRCDDVSCPFTSNRKDNLRQHQKKKHTSGRIGCLPKKSDTTQSVPPQFDVCGNESLHSASNFMRVAASGDVERLKTFLNAGLTVDTKADDQSTALHCGARAGQTEVVKFLLAIGADIEIRNDKNRLPIHEAFLSHSSETVEIFLEKMPREKLFQISQELEKYLMRSRAVSVVDAYITHLGDTFKNRKVSRKLRFAVLTGHALLLNTLLGDPDVNGNVPCALSYASIHLAAAFGRTSTMEVLVACNGIDKTLHCSRKRQALHIAASKGHTAIAKQLIQHPSTDVNCRDEVGATPLHYVSEGGHIMVAEQLLRHPSADVNCLDKDGETPLHYASKNGHTMVAQQLLRHPSIDINRPDNNAATPLHHAASNEHWETVSLLLRHSDSMTDGHCISSDVSPTSLTFTKEDLLHRLFKHPDFGGPNRVLPTENKTILRLAAEKGDCEVIEVLLAYPDIDVNMSDRYVEPALTAAAQNGKMEAVKLLLQHKDIDMNQMPAGGNWSALKYAKFFNHNEIINLLLSHGAIDYDAEAPSIVPTTAHIDNSQNTTLHPEGEIQFDPFDDDMDGAAIETWLELFGTEEGMKE